jgi:prepilin-type N-terminal cleavage/methylation domain-containing protein
MRRYQAGFSLIEVLVAAVILFAVVTASLLIYRSAMATSIRAESALRMSMDIPQARQLVTAQLQGGFANPPRSGRIELSGVNVSWQAQFAGSGQLTNLDAVTITRPGTNSGSEQVALDRKFYLWDVTLDAELGRQRRTFSFRELTWDARQ